jgi:hypothetical protein
MMDEAQALALLKERRRTRAMKVCHEDQPPHLRDDVPNQLAHYRELIQQLHDIVDSDAEAYLRIKQQIEAIDRFTPEFSLEPEEREAIRVFFRATRRRMLHKALAFVRLLNQEIRAEQSAL